MADGVVFNNFPEIANRLHTALSRAVRKTAFEIQKSAQAMSPVDTGFLRSSIYVSTYDKSTYGQGKMKAPKKGTSAIYKVANQESLPEVESPPDEFTAYVAVAASYGVYLEYGTRFMPPQPYFNPAVEMEMPVFEAILGEIEAQLDGGASGSIKVDEE